MHRYFFTGAPVKYTGGPLNITGAPLYLPVHRDIYRWTAKFISAPVKYSGAPVIFIGPPVNFTGAPVKTLIFYFDGVAIK